MSTVNDLIAKIRSVFTKGQLTPFEMAGVTADLTEAVEALNTTTVGTYVPTFTNLTASISNVAAPVMHWRLSGKQLMLHGRLSFNVAGAAVSQAFDMSLPPGVSLPSSGADRGQVGVGANGYANGAAAISMMYTFGPFTGSPVTTITWAIPSTPAAGVGVIMDIWMMATTV